MNITVNGSPYSCQTDTTLQMLAHVFQKDYPHEIILARRNGKLAELFLKPETGDDVTFVTTGDNPGYQTYKRTMIMLLIKAARDILGKGREHRIVIQNSLDKGYYCEMHSTQVLDAALLQKIERRMHELADMRMPVRKTMVRTSEALRIFEENDMPDKKKIMDYRRASYVNLYHLDGYVDYYYGYMAPDTGCCRYFKLHLFDEGFVMQLPQRRAPEIVPPFIPPIKLFREFQQTARWQDLLNVGTVGELNDIIADGDIFDMILVQEALQEKKIAEIAEQIFDDNRRRIILIAGPSSSGKTTFSHRLSIQLRTHGLTPHPIPVDDYFLDRERTPLDAEGKPNFECLEALDVRQFNQDMQALLNGQQVELPVFNFVTGKREYKGHTLQIGPRDVLVIEGIHALNDAMTFALPKQNKFKIYISALTQLNIDNHNRIATTDGRLIRRMVRDAARRGTDPCRTIAMWESVRRGEEKNIFPYQEESDVMFNSALIYELAVLKQYAEPLLYRVTPDKPEYEEAMRLLKFLDYFLGITSENIPINSLIREFIGGSCFDVS